MRLNNFLIESVKYTEIQKFFIKQWGKVLYLDYLHLPVGRDLSISHKNELLQVIENYEIAEEQNDEDELVELDEWIAEGGKTGNLYLFSRATIDSVFSSAQHKAEKTFDVYRYDNNENKLLPNSWISVTRDRNAYSGIETIYQINPNDLIIDAHGLADNNEIIVSTNLLISKNDNV